MRVHSLDYAQENLAAVADQVCNEHKPVLIAREGKMSVVIVSWDDYRSTEETMYLMSSPKNYALLLESIAAAKRGEGAERTLID